LVPPRYDSYSNLNIYERHLESFRTSVIISNSLTDGSCLNCHTTNRGNPDEFVMHFRATNPGTIIYKDGEFRRLNTRTSEFGHPAVYPAWHPSGRFIAFATLMPSLFFHTDITQRSLVFDFNANIALLDLSTNTMLASPKLLTSDPVQETYPYWSPDGKFLYFCRSIPPEGLESITDIEQLLNLQFNLVRIPFDEHALTFGEIETVVDAVSIDKSVSSPKISPDGRFLIFCMTARGTNAVWRQDSDLYLLDLQTLEWQPLTAVNSSDSESHHSWSSNSRWIVFSSKRRDGLLSLPYFSHIDSDGHASKPFLLPQKNPNFYETIIRSFNVPELVRGRTKTNIYDFQKAVKGPLIDVDFGWTNDENEK
jgi:Tol biopolymer transport system component